jgi:hypothetical protein
MRVPPEMSIVLTVMCLAIVGWSGGSPVSADQLAVRDEATAVSPSLGVTIPDGRSETYHLYYRNTGTSTWSAGAGFELHQVACTELTCADAVFTLPTSVPPGGLVSWTVTYTGKAQDGPTTYLYSMEKSGHAFGEAMSHQIGVGG